MIRRLAASLALFTVSSLAHAQPMDDTLKKIRDSKSITIAYRVDALPFSYEQEKQPAGYTVELCKRVVASLSLERALKTAVLSANVVTVKTREEAVAALEEGKADAFASDRILLAGLSGKVKDQSLYEILGDELSFEPYALALPLGSSAFRLAVNRALAQIYASDAIIDVFRSTFGPNAKPSPALVVMYGLNSYPE